MSLADLLSHRGSRGLTPADHTIGDPPRRSVRLPRPFVSSAAAIDEAASLGDIGGPASIREIAQAIGIHRSNVARRAKNEHWTYRESPVRGGHRHEFDLLELPRGVVRAVLSSRAKVRAVQQYKQGAPA